MLVCGYGYKHKYIYCSFPPYQAKLGSSPSSSVGQEASPEAVAKELRARDLEMELAQTKLELVSEQCKNQEMQNKLAELENKLAEQQTGKNKKKK